jgi:hypothetical protein
MSTSAGKEQALPGTASLAFLALLVAVLTAFLPRSVWGQTTAVWQGGNGNWLTFNWLCFPSLVHWCSRVRWAT